ncbi:hypothetical protein ACPV5U_28235, partial [Vibrio mediterranei]
VAGCWLLVAGCWLLVAGCWLLVAGCWLLLFVDAQYWIDVIMISQLGVHTFGNQRFVVFRWVEICLYPASIGAEFYRIQGVNQNTGQFAFLSQVSRASLNHSEKLKCKSVGVTLRAGLYAISSK